MQCAGHLLGVAGAAAAAGLPEAALTLNIISSQENAVQQQCLVQGMFTASSRATIRHSHSSNVTMAAISLEQQSCHCSKASMLGPGLGSSKLKGHKQVCAALPAISHSSSL